MAEKIVISKELQEELIEVMSVYGNFNDEVSEVLNLISKNEELDHENDKARTTTKGFLLKALESFSAKNYEDVDRNVHAAIQKLHDQEVMDLNDDKPRTDTKIKIAVMQQKTLNNMENLRKLLGKMLPKSSSGDKHGR